MDIGAVQHPTTIYTVDLTSANGTGSGNSGDLVYVIGQANANNYAGSLIVFDPTVFASPRTITLSSSLVLSESPWPEAIVGPGAGLVTICGNNAAPAFEVNNATMASLTGLTISGGPASIAPAIVVNGGSLKVRNSTIQESTGSAQSAIQFNGGSLDLGTASSPGGNTINVNGAGGLVYNRTPGPVPAVGDTFSVNGVALPSSSLSFTALNTSVNPATAGQAVTLTATVLANTPGTATPTGSVTFTDTTTQTTLGTMSLSHGTAALTTTALATGTRVIAADYSGDSNYLFSLATVTVTVYQPPASPGNPAVYVVNLTSETGASSGTDDVGGTTYPSGDVLWAVTQANANPNAAGSIIEFDPTVFATPQTITLSSTLVLSESAGPEVIQGSGANLVTISGGLTYNPQTGQPLGVGVFQVDSGVTATLSELTITEGSATNGGGIENAGALAVTDSTITGNNAGNGGGIDNSGSLTVTGSTISNNGASNTGGGIDNSGSLSIIGSTIANNGASSGGGIRNTGTLTITDSTIAHCGGGIDNFGTLTAVNTTIAYNGGAGLTDEPGAAATLYNTIVALNTFQDGNNYYAVSYDDITGAPLSSASAYNVIGLGGSGGLVDQSTDPAHHNQVNVANPGLAAALADNGGPTQTIALLPGSPAVDAGSNALANQYSLTTDQRGAGFPRTVNGTVDIGAFESPVFGNATVYAVTNTSNDPTVTGSLPWAINQANNQGSAGYSPTNPAGSKITFDIPTSDPGYNPLTKSWTITLASTLELSESPSPEVIQGPGASALTISGNNAVQVFVVDGGTTAAISGLTISDGTDVLVNDSGGGVNNSGTLTVADCIVSSNAAVDGGGGIFNGGWLTVTDSTIEGNSAVWGGGILNYNVITLADSTIKNNSAGQCCGGGMYSRLLGDGH